MLSWHSMNLILTGVCTWIPIPHLFFYFGFLCYYLCGCVFIVKAPEDKRDMQPVPNIDHLLSNIGRAGMPGEASGEEETYSDILTVRDTVISSGNTCVG